ncbi:MAG: Holliday junction resolvase RuvX [Eubacteriales bacterium]|nr:Holliday junction resolvase RuvX [Bacillota bacterium]
MRIMGLDFGDKRIGVAVSDPLGWTAQGITVIKRQASLASDLELIRELAAKYNVERIVLGLPRNMDGSSGTQAVKVKAFAGKLSERLKLPVELWDERLTTKAADKLLIEADLSRARRRKVIDKMAASLILQGYLDFQGKGLK